MKRLLLPYVVLSLLACAPLADPQSTPLPDPLSPDFHATQPAAVKEAALLSFSGCGDLEQHLEDRAVLELRLRIASNKKYALDSWDWYHAARYGSTGGGGGGTGGGAGSFDAGSSGSAGGAGGGAGGGPTDYTTTNTQVAGVDESDFVKNDGTRLFVLNGRSLFTASTWPASARARRGEVKLAGRPAAMFLQGDRVVVFSKVFDSTLGAPSWCSQGSYCEEWYSNATAVSFVDVSDLSAPRVVAEQRIAGGFFNARRIGDAMRVITTNAFPFLDELRTWIDWNQQMAAPTKQVLAAMYDALANQQEALVRAKTLADWLPAVRVQAGSLSATVPVSCGDIVSTTASARLGVTNVVTLSMADPSQVTRQALLANVDELYQSHDALYLTQRHWWWWWDSSHDDVTYLYKFDVSQPDRARFKAAGRLDGLPVDQFALDEHHGDLRVAVTETLMVPSGTGGGVAFAGTVNRVVVLREVGGLLAEVGRSEDLAPGERIMSARFVGDVGYVVTFRQVDPLYTLDLSDPTRPRKVGELKVPGFSSYIHPIDATHLLTIGTYIPEQQTDWRERHLQLALFDVSDLANPVQTHTQFVGQAWGWSEAQWDHKAFSYFAARGLLAIPFADWYTDANGSWRYVSDLRVYRVDPQAGFTPKGSLDMADVLFRNGCSYDTYYGCWYWYWTPQIRRSVMADDYVYAVSSGGVRVAHVDSLDTPIATALFDPSP